MIFNVNGSNPGTHHTVDTERVTCTCKDFIFKRSNYSKDSKNRQCKHISKIFKDHPELSPVQTIDDPNRDQIDKDGICRYPRVLFSPYTKAIEDLISKFPGVTRVNPCGEFERLLDKVDKLVFVVSCSDFKSLCSYIEQTMFPIVVSRSDSRVKYLINGLPFEIVYANDYEIYVKSFFYNSSKEEVLRVKKICDLLNYDLSLQGIKNDDGYILLNSEEDLYRLIGEKYKKPYER